MSTDEVKVNGVGEEEGQIEPSEKVKDTVVNEETPTVNGAEETEKTENEDSSKEQVEADDTAAEDSKEEGSKEETEEVKKETSNPQPPEIVVDHAPDRNVDEEEDAQEKNDTPAEEPKNEPETVVDTDTSSPKEPTTVEEEKKSEESASDDKKQSEEDKPTEASVEVKKAEASVEVKESEPEKTEEVIASTKSEGDGDKPANDTKESSNEEPKADKTEEKQAETEEKETDKEAKVEDGAADGATANAEGATAGITANGKPNFNGKFQQVKSENVDTFLQVMGMPWLMRKLATKMSPSQDVKQEGDKFQVKVLTGFMTKEWKFTVGEEFEEKPFPFKSETAKVLATWEDDKLVMTSTPKTEKNKSKSVKTTRELDGDQMTMTFEVGDLVCTRVFQRKK